MQNNKNLSKWCQGRQLYLSIHSRILGWIERLLTCSKVVILYFSIYTFKNFILYVYNVYMQNIISISSLPSLLPSPHIYLYINIYIYVQTYTYKYNCYQNLIALSQKYDTVFEEGIKLHQILPQLLKLPIWIFHRPRNYYTEMPVSLRGLVTTFHNLIWYWWRVRRKEMATLMYWTHLCNCIFHYRNHYR